MVDGLPPVVALDIDGVIRAMAGRWMRTKPPRMSQADYDKRRLLRIELRDREAGKGWADDGRGEWALSHLDQLEHHTLHIRWDEWTVGPRHIDWPAAWGADDQDEAEAGWVPFTRHGEGWAPAGGAAGETRWAPLETDMEVWVPPWLGPWLRGLQERGIELLWSTTWRAEAANRSWAPLLGIEPLGDALDGTEPDPYEGVGAWKLRALLGLGRPFAMLDGRLGIRTNPDLGLTRADAALVDRWLDRQRGSAGATSGSPARR